MEEQKYVMLEDGEKYPIDRVVATNVLESVPGYACGISLRKEDYKLATTETTIVKPVENTTKTQTLEQAQMYLDSLEAPDEPCIVQRKFSWCHKLLYPVYEFVEDQTLFWCVVGSFVTCFILFLVLLGSCAPDLGAITTCAIVSGSLFLASLVVMGLSHIVLHSVFCYTRKKTAYWLDKHNYDLVECTIKRVFKPDNKNPDMLVVMHNSYTQEEKIVDFMDLVFTDEEVSKWATYFSAYKMYLELWNTTTLEMYYPDYKYDLNFLQFMQEKAQYRDGMIQKPEKLVRDYIYYLKELKEARKKQQAAIAELQNELERAKNCAYSDDEEVRKSKRNKRVGCVKAK